MMPTMLPLMVNKPRATHEIGNLVNAQTLDNAKHHSSTPVVTIFHHRRLGLRKRNKHKHGKHHHNATSLGLWNQFCDCGTSASTRNGTEHTKPKQMHNPCVIGNHSPAPSHRAQQSKPVGQTTNAGNGSDPRSRTLTSTTQPPTTIQ